jgi:hypothetical protein
MGTKKSMLLAGVAVLAASLVFVVGTSDGATVSNAAPSIRFTSTVFDFGKVNEDAVVDCIFQFANEGTSPLEVTGVSPSCGCMKTIGWDRSVEPGQTGIIAIQYNSEHYIGEFSKSIWVTCNDTNQARITLEVKGSVWRAVELQPQSAVLNLCAEVPSTSTTVRLISHMDEPLMLSDLKVSGVTVTAEIRTNQPGKEYQLIVKSPLPTPAESQQGSITLKTSSTNKPLVEVRTYVNVLPILMAIPMQIKLPPLPLESAFTNKFWVRNNGTNDLVLSDPQVNAAGVSVEIKPDPNSTTPMSVIAVFPSGFDVPPGTDLQLRLKTNDPLFPNLTVPINQTSRAAGK